MLERGRLRKDKFLELMQTQKEIPPWNTRSRGAAILSLCLIALIGCLGFFQIAPNWVLVLGLMIILIYEFQRRLDLGIPLMQIASLLAVLQWLVGPIWFYHGDLQAGEMGMAIMAPEYFQFAIPGTVCFVLGLLYFGRTHNQRRLLSRVDRSHFFEIGLILNGLAIGADIAGRFAPGQLAFAFFLVAQLRYVGCLYFLYSKNPWKLVFAIASLMPLLLTTAESAMFHDLLLWVGIIVCYWFSLSRRNLRLKFGIVGLGVFGAFTIQAVKGSYRDKVWKGQDASLAGEVLNFWQNTSTMDWDSVLSGAMVRLNQGWIISRVMHHVPAGEPFAMGGTVNDAVTASLVPRFLLPNKAKAGGRVNFIRFTGLPINENTSMNISMLGEGYANFGVVGGILLMGVLGSGLSLAFTTALKWCQKYPTFIFWVPMIFYQAIKAETDLTEVLNQVTKGSLVAVILYVGLRMWYPDKKRRSSTGLSDRRPKSKMTAERKIKGIVSYNDGVRTP